MSFWNLLRVALRALGRNRLRSALTALGIVIGVGVVIALVSIGNGAGESPDYPEIRDWLVGRARCSVRRTCAVLRRSPWLAARISLGVGVAVTFATPPVPMQELRAFFDRVGPFGLWPAGWSGPRRVEHRRDLFRMAFALVWQVLTFLLPMGMMLGLWRQVFPGLHFSFGCSRMSANPPVRIDLFPEP